MRIGCSLPFNLFSDEMNEISKKICESFGGKESLFTEISKVADSVELRAVVGTENPEEVFNAVKILKEHNLWVTIHGDVRKIKTAGEFFRPYIMIFESGFQPFYNITVHTLQTKEESVAILTEICNYAIEKNYPVRITLENERLKNEFSINGICTAVEEIVKQVNSPILFTCFDFGHQLSNIRKFGEEEDVVPDDFLSMARHTHIHSLTDGTTHYPLSEGETLLDKNLKDLINRGYDEVLNLELEAQRFDDKFDIKDAFLDSIAILKAAVYQVNVTIENIPEYTVDYEKNLNNVMGNLEKSSFGIGLVGPAAYVIKIGDKKIAVDISMRKLPGAEKSTALLKAFLKDFDAIIVTHKHYDHYDEELLTSLPESVTGYIPDFIETEMKNKITTIPGFKTKIGDAEIEFFESHHSRGANIVPEYGFAITYNGGTYVFPTDVRTYTKEYPQFTNVKALFVHLWLFQALNLYDNPYIDQFADFVKRFDAEKVYVAHLKDVRRPIDQMWSDMHFDTVKEKFDHIQMFTMGDWAEL